MSIETEDAEEIEVSEETENDDCDLATTLEEEVPVGKYTATITKCEEYEGDYGLSFRFTFSIFPKDNPEKITEKQEMFYFTPAEGKKRKLRRLANIVLGPDYLNDTKELQLRELIGKKCRVKVEADEDEEDFHKITKVFPVQSKT